MTSLLVQLAVDATPTLTVVCFFGLVAALGFSLMLPKNALRQSLVTIICLGFAMNGLANFVARFFTTETLCDPWGILDVVVPASGVWAAIHASDESTARR